jgi:hypothetical protein
MAQVAKPEFTVPRDPTRDYVSAAWSVWQELRAAAPDQVVPVEHKEQSGWIVTGVSPRDIVRSLWPTLVENDPLAAQRLMSTVRNRFTKSGNAACLQQSRRYGSGQWWVPAEWAPSSRRGAASRQEVTG